MILCNKSAVTHSCALRASLVADLLHKIKCLYPGLWESKLGHLTSSIDEDAEKRAAVGLVRRQRLVILCNNVSPP